MAIYRNVQTSFWTDPDVSDDYTPNDKLFYIYLMTNPHTNLCGCYEISIRQMAYEIGFSNKEIEALIEKAETVHKTIAYSRETKELLILRWSKYNWTSSDKFRTSVGKEIQLIKNQEFKNYLTAILNSDTVSDFFDTVSAENGYPIQQDYTVSVADTVSDTVSDSSPDSIAETVTQVIDYLNTECGTNYKSTTENTRKLIKARMKEGYTLDDFYTVISKKSQEWRGTDQEKYLRPETLFGNKFEGYLNQQIRGPATQSIAQKWMNALKIAEGESP